MSKVNHVVLIGYLGENPKLVGNNAENSVLSVSLATHEHVKNAQGEKVKKTDWHNLVAFGKVADLINKYIKKGSYVKIDGRLQTRQFLDKNQQSRYVTEIIVEDILFLDRDTTNDGSTNKGNN